jgi:hypothetical protein
MKNPASTTPIFAASRSANPSWGERLMLRILGLPTEEEAERILRNRPGFFASLTPEQRAAMYAYDGPEVLGPANGPKRKF